MNYLELSSESLKSQNKLLASLIEKTFVPEVVIFVSKGAYTIGIDVADYFNTPFIEIFAERKGNNLKKLISPLLVIMPSFFKKKLRQIEVNSSIHSKSLEREVRWGFYSQQIDVNSVTRILLVDDSCDTGNTFEQCVKEIKRVYKNATVKTAALNIFSKSEYLFKTDYYLYRDTMLMGPWSNDSPEHKNFIRNYEMIFNLKGE